MMTFLVFLTMVLSSFSVSAQDAPAGKAKFDTYCVTCHGATGKGDGPASAALNPKPADLSQTKLSDDELKKMIKEGGGGMGRSTSMPAWGGALSDQDIANIVAHIRSFKSP